MQCRQIPLQARLTGWFPVRLIHRVLSVVPIVKDVEVGWVRSDEVKSEVCSDVLKSEVRRVV